MASLSSKVSDMKLAADDDAEEVVLASHATSAGETIGKIEIVDDASKVMKGGDGAAASDFANYFCSYAFLYHQKQMLEDQHRMGTYHQAVVGNRSLFEGKTVVDVGAGSGVLSVWSGQAGAAKVWSVEFTDMAKHAVTLVKHNGMADTVTVVKGAVEALDLPPKSVDIMIR
jgi:protein arginine N-methyltransferase 1